MKSIIGMFIIFALVYIIALSGILDFFAQKPVMIFSICLAGAMLIFSLIVIGYAYKKQKAKGGKNDEKTPTN